MSLMGCCRRAALFLLLMLAPLATAWGQSGNPSHDALLSRGDAERRNAFHQSLRAAGNACQMVQVAFPAGLDAQRNAYWDIRCADGVTYRGMLPSERFAPVSFINCGALVPPPRSGPCFQTLAAVAAQQANAAAQQAGGPATAAAPATPPAATAAVQGSRFGVAYATEPPLAVWGFANGASDRLEVNMRSIRQCQQAAGQVRCHFLGEIVDQCAALAFAVSRHPRAAVMTADPSTQVLNNRVLARGATQQAAESEAMRLCGANLPAGSTCRIVASGC